MLSLLLWFAVCDHVEDIFEHLDTVQVSEKIRESIFIKILLVKVIHLTYLHYEIYPNNSALDRLFVKFFFHI